MGSGKSSITSSGRSGSSSRRRQDWLVLNPSRRNRKIRLHGNVALAVVRMQQDALRRQRPPSPPPADTDSQLASLVRYKNEAILSKLGGLHGVIQELHTDPSNGIPDDPHDVQTRKQRYGENTYPKPPPKSFLSFLWEAFHDKTLIILMVCAALSLAFGMKTEGPKEGWYDGASIGFAVLLVVFVTATSDYRQSLQFRSLNEEKENIQMQVVRGGRRFGTSIFQIVVGDIVPLNIGDQIPADGLLVVGHSLKVDESSMTGESKLTTIDQSNPFLVSGCKIADGYGTMVVTAVGTNTEWGNLMAAVSEEGEEQTPLQVRLTGVASFIGKLGIAVAAIVFVILIVYYFTGRIAASDKENAQTFQAGKTGGEEILDRLVNIFAIAVTIIVVAVPEGLPLAVTLTLAYSMRKMMADKALVRRLSACETMGSATAICSDKTGTLTLNQMNVVKAWVAGRTTEDCAKVREEVGSEAVYEVLLQGIAQNSSGSVFADRTKPDSPPEVSGSPTEKAVLLWGVSMGMDFEAVRARSAIMQVETFSSEKKRAGVAVTEGGGGGGGGQSIMRVHWKGAAEIVLSLCDSWADGEQTRPLTEEKQAEVKSVIEGMAAASLRCVAFAYRELAPAEVPPESEWESWAIPAEPGLILLAVVGIKDPCRPGVRDSVRLCQEAGVKVRMVTGDNLITAKAIATECGILRAGADDLAIEGQAFRALSDAKRLQLVPKLAVMARSSPNDKLLLVRALKSLGDVVAVTGDGTNDAPALHDADIGLSMGIAGTEVAKESSDIIILDDNFATVVKVVRWGRSVYFNVQKFIQFQLTVNVAALAINFVAAVAGGEVPLTAVQLLWVNLIMDTLGALAIATEPPSDHLMARPPAGRSSPIVTNVMWRNLLAQAAYQVGVLLTLHFRGKAILGLRGPRAGAVNNTVIFNAFVLCQLFNEVNCRQPERLNIFANVARSPLFAAIVAITLALQFVIVEFLGRFASTERLTWQQWLICAGIGLVSWPLAFAVKLIPVPDKPCINTAGLSCFGLKKKKKQQPQQPPPNADSLHHSSSHDVDEKLESGHLKQAA